MGWNTPALFDPDGIGVPGLMPLKLIAVVTALMLRAQASDDWAVH